MKKVMIADCLIVLLALAGCYYVYEYVHNEPHRQIIFLVLTGLILIGLIDLIRKGHSRSSVIQGPDIESISELSLLDEEEHVIKRWNLAGKTSLLIGREDKDENIDIDLTDSEYSALVDRQHAVMNYAAGEWYIEDLYSKNGIRIRKKQDGVCYKVAKNRPCRVSPGDVIFIANTKLLLR